MVAGLSDGARPHRLEFEFMIWIPRFERTLNCPVTARTVGRRLIFDVGRRNDWQPVEPRLGIFLSNDAALAHLSAPQTPCLHLGVCGCPPDAVAPAEFLDTECP
jgi:hypothetical protein